MPDRLRRRFLAGTASFAAATLAGCLGGDDDSEPVSADPIALTDGQECDVCGMLIADHYGPAGQLYYADGKPDDRDGPARFDSIAELLVYHRERRSRGWELRAAFVTDYSSVDYELLEREGTTYISTHANAAAFADATTLEFVVDSGIEGAMGEDIVPFSDREDAEGFVDEHGGNLRTWDELRDADA